jgi:Bifunctional DNA primase/polymerase, N-terminal
MPGIAAETAETYAKFNIPTVPLGDDKKPLVGNFKVAELTMNQSRAYMRRRPEADVLGVPDGPLSGIVRLDIDERGESVLREVIRRAGEPAAVARTASGKYHLLYGNNGERRLTGQPGRSNARPWDDVAVDLCGMGGYSVSPPSRFSDGREYKFEGTKSLYDLLANRAAMPKIRGLPDRAYYRSVGTASPLAFALQRNVELTSGRAHPHSPILYFPSPG